MAAMTGVSNSRGRLTVGGVPAEVLARRFGTPLYAYSLDAVLGRLETLRAAFAGREVLVCYALKANPLGALARALALAGAGCDVVSGGELARALAAGFPPGRVVFSGVGKSDAELSAAVRAGLRAVNIESVEELSALEAAARRARRRARFAVRVIPGLAAGGHAHIVTGSSDTKFGVEPAQALQIARKAARSRFLTLVGLQTHIGSQLLSPAPYRRALKVLLEVAGGLPAGTRLESLDLGGGMGVGYDGGEGLSPAALAAAVLPALRGRPETLLLEPGRWLTAPAGVLLTRVVREKRSARRRFVVVDAGMNDLVRPALYAARHRVVPAARGRGAATPADVVGPVCETADTFARGIALPRTRPGELLALLDAGAYGSSMGSQYNSRPRPAEVLVARGRVRLARRRETVRDLVAHEL